MKRQNNEPCFCNSGRKYKNCCKIFRTVKEAAFVINQREKKQVKWKAT